MKKIIKVRNHGSYLYLYWILTDLCNFKCNYCPERLHSGKFASGQLPGAPSDEQIRLFIDKIIAHCVSNNKRLKVEIAGGEPTLHSMFDEIVHKFSAYGSVSVITNGTRSVEWWEKMNSLPAGITVSLHPEFTNMNKVNELGKYLVTNTSVRFMINLALDNKNWAKTVMMYEQLDPVLRKYVRPKPLVESTIRTHKVNYIYDEQQRAWIAGVIRELDPNWSTEDIEDRNNVHIHYDNGEVVTANNVDFYKNNNNLYYGWNCTAGIDGISVYVDGTVSAGICGIKRLGNINEFEFLNEPITCTMKTCGCPGDHYLSKSVNKL